MNSEIEHRIAAELHKLAAESIANGEDPYLFATITVGINGVSGTLLTTGENLSDDLHEHADELADFHEAVKTNEAEFIESYKPRKVEEGCEGICVGGFEGSDNIDRNEITVGDVVRLKSGGPRMTVNRVDGDNVRCTYFNCGDVVEHLFVLKSVEKVGEESGCVL